MDRSSREHRVLLIGGSGFLGTWLCETLIEEGREPVIVDFAPPANSGVEYHQGDFYQLGSKQDELLNSVGAVYFLAWTSIPKTASEDPATDLKSNVVNGLHVLDKLVRIDRPPRVIYVSSGGALYGEVKEIPIRESHVTEPISAYGISKLALEHYLRLYGRLHGLDHLILRPSNPYGEWQNPFRGQGAVAVFMARIMNGEPIEIWGDGNTVRDYLYAGDLAKALCGALSYDAGTSGVRVFNVGSGKPLSLLELIREIERTCSAKAEITFHPSRDIDVSSVVLDTRRIKAAMDWEAETGLEEGLRKTAVWMRGFLEVAQQK